MHVLKYVTYTHITQTYPKRTSPETKKQNKFSMISLPKNHDILWQPNLLQVGHGYADFSSQLGIIISPTWDFPKKTIRGSYGTWDPSGPLKPPPRNWATRVLEVLFFRSKKLKIEPKSPPGGPSLDWYSEKPPWRRPQEKSPTHQASKENFEGGKDRERGWGSRG